jgi:hypothetical protein
MHAFSASIPLLTLARHPHPDLWSSSSLWIRCASPFTAGVSAANIQRNLRGICNQKSDAGNRAVNPVNVPRERGSKRERVEEGEGEGEETENTFSDQLNPVTLDRGRGEGGSGAKAGKEHANVQKGGRERGRERSRTHSNMASTAAGTGNTNYSNVLCPEPQQVHTRLALLSVHMTPRGRLGHECR